ncbi:MAG: tetratricopeptide repeat protein [Phycisphaerales bacterium]
MPPPAGPPSAVVQAVQMLEAGQPGRALPLLQRAHQRAPRDPGVCNALAAVLLALQQAEQAEFYAQRGLALAPGDPALLTNLGNILAARGNSDGALEALRRAAAIAPGAPQPRQGIGNILRLRGEHTAASREYERALASAPGDPALAAMYTSSLTSQGRAAEGADFARGWLSRASSPAVANALASAVTYHPGATPREVLEAAALHGRLIEASVAVLPPAQPDRSPDRRLRLGILSHELRRHAVVRYLEPLLAHLDPAGWDVVCYSTSPVEDATTERLRGMAPTWRGVAALGDAALAAKVRADRIDILVETSGITAGNRLGAVAMRPAPVQASFAGYANTTGLTRLDWRIVDGVTDPPGAERWSTERLARLDPTYFFYHPSPDPPSAGRPRVRARRGSPSERSPPAPRSTAMRSARGRASSRPCRRAGSSSRAPS